MAIVTAAVLKEYLPEIQGTAADADLTSLLARVESGVAAFLGFPVYDTGGQFKPSRDVVTYTLFYAGPSFTNPLELNLRVKPAHSVTSIHSDPDQVYGSDTLVNASTYTLDITAGIVRRSPTLIDSIFDRARRAIKVIMSAGYSSATAPPELVHAICVWASQLQRMKPAQGRENMSQRGGSITISPKTMPQEVKECLYPYRMDGRIL